RGAATVAAAARSTPANTAFVVKDTKGTEDTKGIPGGGASRIDFSSPYKKKGRLSPAPPCSPFVSFVPCVSFVNVHLNVHGERFVGRMPSLQRGQDLIEQYRRSADHIVAQGIAQRVENCVAAGGHRRLADTARTDRRARIGDVHGVPGHLL